jgi:hypothetical protein
MEAGNCTLYSGGLKGAESVFGETAEKYGITEVIYTFEGHKLHRDINSVMLSEADLQRGDISMELASRMLNRSYYETEKIRKVLQTIFHMVNSGYQIFVIGAILDDQSVKGGTGWAVQLGKMFNRPLHVFDQTTEKWCTWARRLGRGRTAHQLRDLCGLRYPLPQRRRAYRHRGAVRPLVQRLSCRLGHRNHRAIIPGYRFFTQP